MVVIIDPQSSGIAGNMVIGSLIDLGADKDKLEKVIRCYASPFGEIDTDICKIKKNGIKSTFASINCKDSKSIKYNELIKRLDSIKYYRMSSDALNLAKNIFKTLAIAESHVHGSRLSDVHFHEVGAADAVADIVGTAYAFYELGLNREKVLGLPISLGGGTTKINHGITSIPAPATLEILKDVPTVGGPVAKELTTPTGAAIYVNIVDEYCQFQPLLAKKSTGYGAGKMNLEYPNVLRIITGSEISPVDKVSVLETNLDNVSGEILGNLFNLLMDAGALDVSLIPIIMKKNRPGHLLKVITKPQLSGHISEIIIRETGTLGVRMIPFMHRNIIHREIITINAKFGTLNADIRIKVGLIGEEIVNSAPEYEDAHLISKKTGIPLKEVMRIAEESFWTLRTTGGTINDR
jgi:uncharacterized protein (TIGR00299 family) protein